MRALVTSLSTSAFMIGFGMVALSSVYDWSDIVEGKTAQYSLQDLKKKLLQSSDLFASHHSVYEKAGEEEWETTIKPNFMNELTRAVIADTGNPVPEEDDILNWVENNPERVKAMMEGHGNVFDKVKKENQGVRDWGVGEGKDGAGQGKGQGVGPKK